MKVPVNKIIPMSVVDGPGNRTSIFLQKCNLTCSYCHNPETQQICIHCGVCGEYCPVNALEMIDGKVVWKEDVCVQCDNCIRVCPHFASPKIQYMDAAEVFAEVEKNIPFIRGITVSGGECTLYPEFMTELFTLAKAQGLTCYIDSNGCTDLRCYPELMNVCDKVMLDVKAWDEKIFQNLAGGEVSIVKNNLQYLAEADKLEEVRIVCLEQEVDIEAAIAGIAEMVQPFLDRFTLKLIAFRNHGVRGKLESTKTTDYNQMEQWKKFAKDCGFSHIRTV